MILGQRRSNKKDLKHPPCQEGPKTIKLADFYCNFTMHYKIIILCISDALKYLLYQTIKFITEKSISFSVIVQFYWIGSRVLYLRSKMKMDQISIQMK